MKMKGQISEAQKGDMLIINTSPFQLEYFQKYSFLYVRE